MKYIHIYVLIYLLACYLNVQAQTSDPCLATVNTLPASYTSQTITNSSTGTTAMAGPTDYSYTSATPSTIFNTTNVCENLWYAFTVPASGGMKITFSPAGTDFAAIAYSATGCAGNVLTSPTILGAHDGATTPDPIQLSCLTPGSIVYVRVHDFGCNSTFTFGISATDISATAGDEPANAISLTFGAAATPVTINTTSLTETKIPGVSSCPSGSPYNNDNGCEDIWYTVTSTGYPIDFTISGSTLNVGIEAFTGTCPSSPTGFTSIDCDGGSNNPVLSIPAQPIGTVIYVRVWDADCNENRTFNIEADLNIDVFATNGSQTINMAC